MVPESSWVDDLSCLVILKFNTLHFQRKSADEVDNSSRDAPEKGRESLPGSGGGSLVYWIAHIKGNRLKPLVQRRTREEGNSLPFWVILSSLIFST